MRSVPFTSPTLEYVDGMDDAQPPDCRQPGAEAFAECIRSCRLCAGKMPNDPNPVLVASSTARILIASQAPGNLADRSGRPFDDPSGRRLRDWMGVGEDVFYDSGRVAIAPMGFCFPGYDKKGGDRPPMKICAPTWRAPLLERMPQLRLTLLIGAYSQRWHLGARAPKTLTETVRRWREWLEDGFIATPHPSWRNNAWLKRNPWFEQDILPELRERVAALT